ncbi:tol-pal system protein YbgF [Vibrio sp. WXL103]|uniref:tol-pal system protein YbgF n=1 Tax=Vibrio sp. WXL103 TaxID=3450710 RepID=UPI003EC6EAAA
MSIERIITTGRVFTLSGLALALSGAAIAAPAPVADITATNATVTATATNTAAVSGAETEVQRLERVLESRNRTQARMQMQMDEMAQEISELRGQLEQNSYELQQMLQRQRELFIELDKVRTQAPAVAVVPVESDEDDAPIGGKATSNAGEQQAYQEAVDLVLKKRDYSAAIVAFQEFQEEYPDSTYSANAHYWLGQLYFAKKQDKDAVKSFAAVVSHKESNKRADAILKLGEIARRNDNMDAAKKYYQQVISEYPDSASAKLARERIK